MTSINRLSANDSINPGDSIPVWSSVDGRTRRISGATLLSYVTDKNIKSLYFDDADHLIIVLNDNSTIDAGQMPKSNAGVIYDGALVPELAVTNGIKGDVKDSVLLLTQTMARTAWYFVDVPVSSAPYEIKTAEQMGIDYEFVGSPEPQSVQLFQEGLADGSQIKVSVNGYKSTDKPVNVFQETPTGTYNWHVTTPTVFMLHNAYWRVEESSQLIHIDGSTVYGTNAEKSPVHAITTDPSSALTATVNSEGVMILGGDGQSLDQYQRKDAEEIDYPLIKQSGDVVATSEDLQSEVEKLLPRSGGTITGNLKIVDDSDEPIFETNKETKSISYKGRQTADDDVITVAAVKSLIDDGGSEFDPKKWFGAHQYEEVSSSVGLNVEVAHIALTTDGGWTTSVVFSPDLDYGEVYIIANRGTGPYKIANITAPNLKTMQVKVFKDLTYHVKVSATEGVSVEAIKSSNEVSTSAFDIIDTSSFDSDVKIKLLKKSFENKDLISIPVEIPDGFEIIVSSVLCKSNGKVKRELFEYVYENGILRVHLQSVCSGLIIAELIK